jgi:hypothetical protein
MYLKRKKNQSSLHSHHLSLIQTGTTRREKKASRNPKPNKKKNQKKRKSQSSQLSSPVISRRY